MSSYIQQMRYAEMEGVAIKRFLVFDESQLNEVIQEIRHMKEVMGQGVFVTAVSVDNSKGKKVNHNTSWMVKEFNTLGIAEKLLDEKRQLFLSIKDISALFMENRQIMAKVKTLNEEWDEFSTETQESSCDDFLEVVDGFLDVRTEWMERETCDSSLAAQPPFCQDLSQLHHRSQNQPQHLH